MSNELQLIPFHGDQIAVVMGADGRLYGVVHMMCKSIGLDSKSQRRRLRDAHWATKVMIPLVAADGKLREFLCILADDIPMWLARCDSHRVHPGVRDKIELWQREAHDVLRDHAMCKAVAEVPHKQLSIAEISLLHSQALVDQERRQKEAERKIEDHDARLAAIEDQRDREWERLRSLPGPTVEVLGKSSADLTEQRDRWSCHRAGLSYRDGWNRLYEEFRRRYHIDCIARFRQAVPGKYKTILDVVRELTRELQEHFYALACELFPLEPTGG